MKLGLNRDVPKINQPEGSYTDARNMVYSERYGALSNEDGFDELFDLEGQTMGIIPLNNDSWVVFLIGGGFDEIGLVEDDTYTRILRTTSTDSLNLNANYPIKGKFRLSNRGHRIIVFTDNFNPPRILNIDDLPFPVDADKIPTEADSIAILSLFSAGNPPTIEFSLSQTGGFLKSGAYFFSTAYVMEDNQQLGFTSVVGPVKINEEATGTTTYDGCEADTVTSKTITLSIDDVDNRYRYLDIGVLSVIGGERTFFKVGRIEIVQGTTSYTFTYIGNELTEDRLLEEVTVQTQGLYNTAKSITTLNDQLILGNLGSREPYDYQEYANDIVINWTLEDVYQSSSNPNIVDVSNLQKGGFRAFEVYAFYIAFRYKDGSYSQAYHIPGRASTAGETDASAILTTALKFQVEDTCATDGTMSFWENQSEVYPEDFPDFAGENVRHHKFPSLNFIMDNATTLGQPGLVTTMGLTSLPVLGFDASNVVIPVDLEEEIDGWQIFYAKRDINNMTCIGQGHLIFGHRRANNDDLFVGLCNAEIQESHTKPDLDRLSFHSPDLILNKPSIAPTYVRNEIELEIRVDTSYTGVQADEGPILESTSDSFLKIYKLFDYIGTGLFRSTAVTNSADLIREVSVSNPLYMPANIVTGQYFNTQSSEYISLNIDDANSLTIGPDLADNDLDFTAAIGDRKENTYLSNLCQLITTVYSSFASQTLVTATSIIDSSVSDTTGVDKTGDNYLSDYSFVGTIFEQEDYLFDPDDTEVETEVDTLPRGIKFIRRYICESNINIKFRHEGLDSNSKYYGKTDFELETSAELEDSFLTEWDISKEQIIEYNSDYSVLNTINPVFPYDRTIDHLTRYPFRVIVSERNANELADSGWRMFLPNNYKDVVTIKGEITNLEGYDDVLLIHVKDSLYRTIGAQKLQTSTESVTIGVGDLFAFEPKEILTSELGYLGNQHRFGCGVTKLGYVFFDANQGKIFIVGKDVKEISSKGLRTYLRDSFRGETDLLDAPFNTSGVNMAYDEKYNRLLLSKKGNNGSFTLSYSPDQDGFTSFHDYIPDYMFNTRNNVYSIKDLTVYKHNSEDSKATYYTTVQPSYVELILNGENTMTKYFSNINWQTEIIDSDDASLFTKTFTKILLYNSYQCSGEIDLIYPTNIFNAETTWNFNKFYDIVRNRALPFIDANGLILSNLNTSLAWFKQRRFVDKWLAVKLIYNNTDQNTLFLYNVDALMRKSGR